MQSHYTVPEVAALLQRDPSTIWKLVKRGKIYSHGRPIRIQKSALQDYLSDRAVPDLFSRT